MLLTACISSSLHSNDLKKKDEAMLAVTVSESTAGVFSNDPHLF